MPASRQLAILVRVYSTVMKQQLRFVTVYRLLPATLW